MTEGLESEEDDLKFEAFGKHDRLTKKAGSLGQALKTGMVVTLDECLICGLQCLL